MRENIDVFDFELAADDVAEIERWTPATGPGPTRTRSPLTSSLRRIQDQVITGRFCDMIRFPTSS